MTAADVMAKLARVESALKARPGTARMLPDPNRADHAVLRLVRNDPLARPIP